MDEAAKVITRGWVDMLIGTFLLCGGLVLLCLPVHLKTYDQWGIQLSCGNGYRAELLQATVDDQGHDPQDPQFATAGATTAARTASNYVDQCKDAVAHRRLLAIPVACVGALILIPELVLWVRAGSSTSSASINEWSATPSDVSMRDMSLQTAA